MDHLYYMNRALTLAKKGAGSVSPNPMVGCVIVNDGRIVGEGFHRVAGGLHAEVIALQQAGMAAQKATAYITLEPCCHVGRTPPCTNALIEAGIKTVYVACQDPNPLVAGKGIEYLIAQGVHVFVGLYEKDAVEMNKVFFHYIKNKAPFVYAKWAMSLDGKTITHPDDSRTISTSASLPTAHALRREVDAILIGAHTALQDNPQLTARHDQLENKMLQDKQPIRFLLTGKNSLPLNLNLFNKDLPGKTVVIAARANQEWLAALEKKQIETIIFHGENLQMNLHELLSLLGKRQISSLLVEGGMTVLQQFFKFQLINEIIVYLSSCLIGDMSQKKYVTIKQINQFDHDYQLIANPHYFKPIS